jgi:hypothetical protein
MERHTDSTTRHDKRNCHELVIVKTTEWNAIALRDMITAEGKLHHSLTSGATTPVLFCSQCQCILDIGILRTDSLMASLLANCTCWAAAFLACRYVRADIVGEDESTALWVGTVCAVSGAELYGRELEAGKLIG